MGIFGESPFFSGYKATLKQLFNTHTHTHTHLCIRQSEIQNTCLLWVELFCYVALVSISVWKNKKKKRRTKNKKQKELSVMGRCNRLDPMCTQRNRKLDVL